MIPLVLTGLRETPSELILHFLHRFSPFCTFRSVPFPLAQTGCWIILDVQVLMLISVDVHDRFAVLHRLGGQSPGVRSGINVDEDGITVSTPDSHSGLDEVLVTF